MQYQYLLFFGKSITSRMYLFDPRKSCFLLFVLVTFIGACGPAFPDDWLNPPKYGSYSQAAVHYFLEIGLGSEFGDPTNVTVKKWASEIRIQIHGNYNQSDENELESIISELSELTSLSIKRVTSNANINIYFAKQTDFKRYIPQYNTSNPQNGVFASLYQGDHITEATICIEDHLVPPQRHHLLREELTQTMGLQKDSYSYQNSVFQQSPDHTPTEYSQIDKEVIRILYDKKIKPGMSKTEIENTLITTQIASN
ncbi:MAG: DUF2927 domain-containing protein [Bdellovibrionales bacterium]|nr:DUF2927 domain-containing protein [Bdellovibrionales bacterium]